MIGYLVNSSDNILKGLGGNDRLEGGAGADQLYGGSGEDSATYAGSDAAIELTIEADGNAAGIGGHADGDMLYNFEHFEGSAHDDSFILNGNRFAVKSDDFHSINGGDGSDTISFASHYETVIANLATGQTGGGGLECSILRILAANDSDRFTGNDADNGSPDDKG